MIQKSIEIKYRVLRGKEIWGDRWGSNPRQLESQSRALPTELRPPLKDYVELVCPTGIEPATPSLEGWCSIRLSYGHNSLGNQYYFYCKNLVGVERFELPTSCSQSRRATRLRYTPKRATIPISRQKINSTRGFFLLFAALPASNNKPSTTE